MVFLESKTSKKKKKKSTPFHSGTYLGAQPRSSKHLADVPSLATRRHSREYGCLQAIPFSQTLGWGGWGPGGFGVWGGVWRWWGEMQLALKKYIHLFSEIMPLAVLQGKGCRVTCCQVPGSAWGKCGRERYRTKSSSLVPFKLFGPGWR